MDGLKIKTLALVALILKKKSNVFVNGFSVENSEISLSTDWKWRRSDEDILSISYAQGLKWNQFFR